MNTTVAEAPNNLTALLVGCGSTGQKHLQQLLPSVYSIAVVDLDDEALAWAKAEAERVRETGVWAAHVNTSNSLDEVLEYAPFDVAHIAVSGDSADSIKAALIAAGQVNFG